MSSRRWNRLDDSEEEEDVELEKEEEEEEEDDEEDDKEEDEDGEETETEEEEEQEEQEGDETETEDDNELVVDAEEPVQTVENPEDQGNPFDEPDEPVEDAERAAAVTSGAAAYLDDLQAEEEYGDVLRVLEQESTEPKLEKKKNEQSVNRGKLESRDEKDPAAPAPVALPVVVAPAFPDLKLQEDPASRDRLQDTRGMWVSDGMLQARRFGLTFRCCQVPDDMTDEKARTFVNSLKQIDVANVSLRWWPLNAALVAYTSTLDTSSTRFFATKLDQEHIESAHYKILRKKRKEPDLQNTLAKAYLECTLVFRHYKQKPPPLAHYFFDTENHVHLSHVQLTPSSVGVQAPLDPSDFFLIQDAVESILADEDAVWHEINSRVGNAVWGWDRIAPLKLATQDYSLTSTTPCTAVDLRVQWDIKMQGDILFTRLPDIKPDYKIHGPDMVPAFGNDEDGAALRPARQDQQHSDEDDEDLIFLEVGKQRELR